MRQSKGFTLLEMIVVLIVMGATAILMQPLLNSFDNDRRVDFALSQVNTIEAALDEYYLMFCGQATFPQPTLTSLQNERLVIAPFERPAFVSSIQTAIYNPNSPRATLSVSLSFGDSDEAARFMRDINKASDNASSTGSSTLEFRSLTELNSTARGSRMKENRDNHLLTGC